jgi:tryptophanyl-tRNA synthetase
LPMVELQKKHAEHYQLNMFVPDLHSFTTPIDHSTLYDQTIANLKVFVAAGLDINNENTFIYRQSYIPAHSELTWILDCFSGFGELSRMTEFKDKSQKQENSKFGDVFVVPEDNAKQTEFAGRSEPVRIRSLRNPERKMSKSVEDPAGTIMLSDSSDEAAQKVTSATTDSEGAIHWDWQKQPGITNLLQILSLLSNRSKEEAVSEWEGKSSYGELKAAVAESVRNFLSDFQQKLSQVNHDQLMQKLEADEAAMSTVANQTLERVQQAVGLRPKL